MLLNITEQCSSLGVTIEPRALLSNYTTFCLGGPCQALIPCQNPSQLENTVQRLSQDKLPFILIGGGSNLVVSDEGIDCFVIRYLSEVPLIEQDGEDLVVSGSTLLDDLALFAAEKGLAGLNYTSGIPGTVGGAVVGNAGAFGKQVGDILKFVTLVTRTGERKKVGPESLHFKYRDSLLKETGDIVRSVQFFLKRGQRETLLKERQDILDIRREKHPNLTTHPCAGSFFRNIEPTSKAGQRQAAGWFLEQAGGKQLSVGGAKIFEKHANIIVKSDGCRAQDVFELSRKMAQAVKENFSLELIREVRFVGRFEGMPANIKEVIW